MSAILIDLAMLCYLLAFILFFRKLSSRQKWLFIGFVFHTLFIIQRWFLAARPPFANFYEALIIFSWAMLFVYMVFTAVYKILIPVFPVSFLVLTTLLPTFFLDNTIRPLIPALQSIWMSFHVITYFIGYASLAISFVISLTYLYASAKAPKEPAVLFLDNLSFQLIAFAFPLLTFGMTSGSVWANIAWGSYWSWDPKETCALINWLVYVVYLHLRILKGWKERKAACLAIIGFLVTLFTFVGARFIFSGLHNY